MEEGTIVTFDLDKDSDPNAPKDTRFENGSRSITVPIENTLGKVTVSLIAGKETGVAKVTATVTLAGTAITQSVYVPVTTYSITLDASPTSVKCGGSAATITATLKDYTGVVVSGAEIQFTGSDQTTATTDANGQAFVTFTPPGSCSTAGTATVRAEYEDASNTIAVDYVP